MKHRKMIAIAAAPIAAPLGIVSFFTVANGFDWPFNRTDIWWITIIATAVSYLGLFLVGIPIVNRMRRSYSVGLMSLTLVGAITGLLVFIAFSAVFAMSFGAVPSIDLVSINWGVSLGVLVALSYGLIAGKEA